MTLRARLRRLGDRLGARTCALCHGTNGQIQIIDVGQGEEPAWPPPLSRPRQASHGDRGALPGGRDATPTVCGENPVTNAKHRLQQIEKTLAVWTPLGGDDGGYLLALCRWRYSG